MAFKKEVVEIIEPRDVFVGNIKADVTLEEFGEYESEACAKANEVVKKLLEDYEGKIRFNFSHFPLTKFTNEVSRPVKQQLQQHRKANFGKCIIYYLPIAGILGTTSLKLHSKEAGVNNKRFLDELVNATYGWQVQGDMREGLNRGVKDVPTFFVNGVRVTGKPTYDELSKAIDAALKKTKQKKKVPAKQRA